jgi:small-conductance mechanosensitive channel
MLDLSSVIETHGFKYLLSACIFLALLLAGVFIRSVLLKVLKKAVKRTRSRFDDIIIDTIKNPSFLWIFIPASYLALQVIPAMPEQWAYIVDRILLGLIIISVTWVAANIVSKLLAEYASKISPALPITSLTQNFVKLSILLLGVMILLDSLGVKITTLITALGIGSLAVALALQDTLSNLFAGIHILIDRPIQLGQFIKLDSGEEGYVAQIGWRSVKVRMLPNNSVVIPNSKLVNSVLTNYYYPEKELAVLVQVGVHYKSDLEHVERVTIEVAKNIMKTVKGGVPDFKPFIRYHTFNDFSIDFDVILRARTFIDQYRIRTEFMKRLHERYKKEGIVIPYPIRTVEMADKIS